MSVTLTRPEYENIYHLISEYWNNLTFVNLEGLYNIGDFNEMADLLGAGLESVYERGEPRRSADRYLWNLNAKFIRMHRQGYRVTFTEAEINELERQVKIMHASDPPYQLSLQNAVRELLDLLRNSMIVNNSTNMNVNTTGGKRSRRARKTRKARKVRKGSRRHK